MTDRTPREHAAERITSPTEHDEAEQRTGDEARGTESERSRERTFREAQAKRQSPQPADRHE